MSMLRLLLEQSHIHLNCINFSLFLPLSFSYLILRFSTFAAILQSALLFHSVPFSCTTSIHLSPPTTHGSSTFSGDPTCYDSMQWHGNRLVLSNWKSHMLWQYGNQLMLLVGAMTLISTCIPVNGTSPEITMLPTHGNCWSNQLCYVWYQNLTFPPSSSIIFPSTFLVTPP